MKVDNMKNAVTFTFFSFLLLTIATFLVFYRYDLYNADTTFIRIRFTTGDSRNETEKNKDIKPKIQTSSIGDGDGDSVQTVAQKDEPKKPPAHNTHFYDTFLAIFSSHSPHLEESYGNKPSLGEEIITKKPVIEDPVARTIFKLAKSKELSIAPERTSESLTTKSAVDSSSGRSTFIDPEMIFADNSPSKPSKQKPNEKPSTRWSGVQEDKDGRQVVSYPAERLPAHVSSTFPPRSWPSLFLPDSGFADSAEISPFSLFSRIADILGSDENEELQTHDLPKMWTGFDDFKDFLNPRKRFLQGYGFADLDSENDSDFYGDYD